MHELSIAQSIVKAVKRRLPEGERRGVKSVRLKVGGLAGVNTESLEFCFGIASEGTAVQGARLEIENVPAVCLCRNCGSGFEAGRHVTVCPNCENPRVELVSGDELDLVEVELAGRAEGEQYNRAEGEQQE